MLLPTLLPIPILFSHSLHQYSYSSTPTLPHNTPLLLPQPSLTILLLSYPNPPSKSSSSRSNLHPNLSSYPANYPYPSSLSPLPSAFSPLGYIQAPIDNGPRSL